MNWLFLQVNHNRTRLNACVNKRNYYNIILLFMKKSFFSVYRSVEEWSSALESSSPFCIYLIQKFTSGG